MPLLRLSRFRGAAPDLSTRAAGGGAEGDQAVWNSYRDQSISHEEVTNRILDDLVAATDPVWMQLEADFNPRGNVHTVVRVSHGTRQPC